jgi:hypothetical protein
VMNVDLVTIFCLPLFTYILAFPNMITIPVTNLPS